MAWVSSDSSLWSVKCSSTLPVEPTGMDSIDLIDPLQLSPSLLDWKSEGAARLESVLLLERILRRVHCLGY